MTKGFWKTIKKPAVVMAPMADVTDAAFRQMFARYGRPDVVWTEFVSADGLFLAPDEHEHEIMLPDELRDIAVEHGIAPHNPLLKDLIFTNEERPIVAQFFSNDPGRMERAGKLAVALGFDGIDINMGCPADVIVKQGAGCAMIKDPKRAQEIIRATQTGVDGAIPVTVKTRIGFYDDSELEEWLPKLLEVDPAVVTLHARTKKDMSKVPARWGNISRAVEIRDDTKNDVLIFGNGDVETYEEGIKKAHETGADGTMVGRGMFGNPWFWNNKVKKEDLSEEEVLGALLEHIALFEELLADTKPFHIMKKHFKAYISGWEGAKELRTRLMEASDVETVKKIIKREIGVEK